MHFSFPIEEFIEKLIVCVFECRWPRESDWLVKKEQSWDWEDEFSLFHDFMPLSLVSHACSSLPPRPSCWREVSLRPCIGPWRLASRTVLGRSISSLPCLPCTGTKWGDPRENPQSGIFSLVTWMQCMCCTGLFWELALFFMVTKSIIICVVRSNWYVWGFK